MTSHRFAGSLILLAAGSVSAVQGQSYRQLPSTAPKSPAQPAAVFIPQPAPQPVNPTASGFASQPQPGMTVQVPPIPANYGYAPNGFYPTNYAPGYNPFAVNPALNYPPVNPWQYSPYGGMGSYPQTGLGGYINPGLGTAYPQNGPYLPYGNGYNPYAAWGIGAFNAAPVVGQTLPGFPSNYNALFGTGAGNLGIAPNGMTK